MEFQFKQALIKTPQGVNATRSGDGLSSKAHAVLRSFDGIKSVADLKKICVSAAMSEADFVAALSELKKFEYLRAVDAAAEAKAKAEAEAEAKMLMTLDFTAMPTPAKPAAAPARPAAAPAKPVPPRPAPARVSPVTSPKVAASVPSAPTAAAAAEAQAREAKAASMKLEAEVRQKLVVALQPRVEEELRNRLRPKLEEELRPKLVAALRPGIEAELRTALTAELTPRIEVELKARFAKSLAAQKAADQQAVKAETPAPPAAPTPAVPVDSAFERVLASLNTPVFSVDLAGVCTYMSPAWAQFSGFTAAEVSGKPLAQCFAEGERRAVSAFLEGIACGTALRFEYQGTLLRKGGAPQWVEISAAPLYAASGTPMGVCGALRDASESRRVAAQAEADGVRLLLLVDQIDTGVILEDADGNIQQTNSALCTLLSLDSAPYSLEGMAVTELLEHASRSCIGPDGFLRRMAEIREAGEDAKGETFVMSDGRVLSQDYLAVAVEDVVVGRLWLFREVPRAQVRAAP